MTIICLSLVSLKGLYQSYLSRWREKFLIWRIFLHQVPITLGFAVTDYKFDGDILLIMSYDKREASLSSD